RAAAVRGATRSPLLNERARTRSTATLKRMIPVRNMTAGRGRVRCCIVISADAMKPEARRLKLLDDGIDGTLVSRDAANRAQGNVPAGTRARARPLDEGINTLVSVRDANRCSFVAGALRTDKHRDKRR